MWLIEGLMNRLLPLYGIQCSFFPAVGGGSSGVDIGDSIANSLMLDPGQSQYASFTCGTPTLQNTWTLSWWGKLTGEELCLLQSYVSGSDRSDITIQSAAAGGKLVFNGTNIIFNSGSAVFRDPIGHGHICLRRNGTASYVLEVNGVTVPITWVAGSAASADSINTAVAHWFGKRDTGSVSYSGGYYAKWEFIDGQALPASNFGRFSADTGQWVHKKYSGSYGNNGRKYEFLNGSSLGTDTSGNNNHATLNGGINSTNQTSDTPTKNFWTLSPIADLFAGYRATLSKGNTVGASGGNATHMFGTFPIPANSSDGWFWSGKCTSMDTARTYIGVVCPEDGPANTAIASYGFNSKGVLGNDGLFYQNSTSTHDATFTSYAQGDVIDIAYKAGKLWVRKNGVWMNSGDPVAGTGALTTTLNTAKNWFPYFGYNSTWEVYSGAKTLPYAAPAGFKTLCTANLPDVAINNSRKHFDVLTWIGNNTSPRSYSGLLFKPDLIDVKSRSAAYGGYVANSIQGGNRKLRTDATTEEVVNSPYGIISAFNADGFTTTAGASDHSNFNENNTSYVAWCRKMGGAPVTNTQGSIQSQVSANVEAGQSIVTYGGTGVNATVGHGLSKAPELVIVHGLSLATDWTCWHKDVATLGAGGVVLLNDSGAWITQAGSFNSTAPTSTVFSLGTYAYLNGNGSTFIASCFHSVEGYSKVGKYIGNGSSDGPFVYCGFKPRYILIRDVTGGGSWFIFDTLRNKWNNLNSALWTNGPWSEDSSTPGIDVTATGFKVRHDGSVRNINVSGRTIIFYAVGDPTKYATAF